MPLYDFRCENKECKTQVFDVFMASEDIHSGCSCPECNKKARRIFTPIPFKFDFKAGFDVGQGEYFDSAKQRNDSADKKQLTRIKD